MKQVNILGYGVNAIEHLTLNAITVLENSDLVLALAANAETELLSKFSSKIKNISFLYKDGDKDIDNYYRIYTKTLSLLEYHKNITILVAGHPRLGVTLTKLFEIQAEKNNYK